MRVYVGILGSMTVALVQAGTVSAPVSFYKDVLPVLQKNCQTCHRPGEIAPASFLSYESTRPWAKAIKTAVLTKKMPPWFADPHFGKFANDRRLSEADIRTLVAWVDAGAPAGDSKDAPKPVDWVEGWRIGKPDVVISMPLEYHVPASGTIDYQYIVIPTGFTEDKYVQLAEARPGDTKLVHHIIAFVREPGNPWMKDAKPGVPYVPKEPELSPEEQKKEEEAEAKLPGIPFQGDFLVDYAPGTVPEVIKPGRAKLIKAGSDLVLQMHYTANGTEGTDISKIGLIFSKTPPKERMLTINTANLTFSIPPGAPDTKVDAKMTLQQDATLVSFLPHMHFRGSSFEYRATYPDGKKEVLLSVPHYEFNWQLTYDLAREKKLPKGTVIECEAHFDNS
ncbi:MAG: cytochrome c, partial [Bryobacteraceae bacterium]